MINIKISYKILLSQKYLRRWNFWQWNGCSLNIFKNLHRNVFSLFVFIKWKNHCNVHLMIHIECVALICFVENWRSSKRPFLKNGSSNMLSHFSRFFTISCLYSILAKNLMKKLTFFYYQSLIFITRITILPIFTILDMLTIKWRPFQYNTKFRKKKTVFIDVCIRLLVKTLWKNCFF